MAATPYECSSQFAYWTFTAATLNERRVARHAASVERLAEFPSNGASTPAVDAASKEGSVVQPVSAGVKRKRGDSTDGDSADAPGKKRLRGLLSSMEYLTVAEEELLVHWAQCELLVAARRSGFDRAVTATALVFLKRYFIHAPLADVPPQDIIPAALFLAIKAEACPYTEQQPLRHRLAALEEEHCSKVQRMLHSAAAVEAASTAAAGGAGASASTASSALAGTPQQQAMAATEGTGWSTGTGGTSTSTSRAGGSRASSALFLQHELRLLMGCRYHLTVYHPYRPLRALLTEAVQAYAYHAIARGGSGTGDAAAPAVAVPASVLDSISEWLPPDVTAFQASWDLLQARAMLLADVALTTDAPLLYTPAQVGAACLRLAATNVASSVPASGGSGAPLAAPAADSDGQQLADSFGDLLKPLATAPNPDLSRFLLGYLDATLAAGGASPAAAAVHSAVQACEALVIQAVQAGDPQTAALLALCKLDRVLCGIRDAEAARAQAAAASGSAAPTVADARHAYKAEKPEREARAQSVYDNVVAAENAAWGIKPLSEAGSAASAANSHAATAVASVAPSASAAAPAPAAVPKLRLKMKL